MAFLQRRQRRGRAAYWVCGVLLAALAGLFAYQWWTHREHHKQDDEEVRRAQEAKFRKLSVDAHDWPQWRGPNRDGIAPGDGLLTSWPKEGPPLLWKVKGGGGYSASSIADGRLITLVQRGEEETVVCWDAVTGKERWQVGYPCKFTQNGEGPRASPTIEGRHVYTVGSRGLLLCLEVDGGKEVWRKELVEFGGKVPYWGYSFSPLIDGDALIVLPGGANAVMALDRKTGAVRWKTDLEAEAGYSSPILCTLGGKPHLLVFLGKELVGLEPTTGTVSWKFPWDTKYEVNAATPIVVELEKNGAEESREAYVFISSDYGKGCALVHLTREKDGGVGVRQVYKNNLMKNHFGTCVLYKDHLYGFDDAYLTCLPFRKGRPKAWFERSFKGRGTVLLAGDQLIVLDEFGKLALVDPTPEEYREKASFQVTDKLTWTMPVLAQKRLYVRDEEWLYCYDLRAK